MPRSRRLPSIVIAIVLLLAMAGLGCSQEAPTQPASPAHVEVQYVLIGFQGTIPGRSVSRTEAEALSLALNILWRARFGEDFSQLVQQYSDDHNLGIIRIANTGITPGAGEYPRAGVVQGFGDTSFSLSVGGIGLASYDPRTCPFGWFIIKRLR